MIQAENENIDLKANGKINLKDITADVNVNNLAVAPAVRKFLPKELTDNFLLENVNLNSTGMKISYSENGIKAQGSLGTIGIKLGGKTFLFHSLSLRKQTSMLLWIKTKISLFLKLN